MHDFLVIGAGSSGCVLAAELARREVGRVLVLEAGPSEKHPLVSMPLGLVWLLGSARDWRYKSAAQANAAGRHIGVPRGRMVGGSGSINSMVWFRGRKADFDAWDTQGWDYASLEPVFEAVEKELQPTRLTNAHPLVHALESLFGDDHPTPEKQSAGLFAHNMPGRRRRSAADAFLRQKPEVTVQTGAEVDRLIFEDDRAVGAILVDGTQIRVAKGVVLAAGSLGSPAILMRSGIGPAQDLEALGITPRLDAPQVGQNLHDHPGIGLHFEGPRSGYGLEPAQWPRWALAPFQYALARKGILASPTCEGGAFFNARGTSNEPDIQSHFIPFFLPHGGPKYQMKAGYFADVCLCRPKSRGRLRLASKDPKAEPHIDLGLFNDESDLDTMVEGVVRLRALLQEAPLGNHRAPEVFPGQDISGEELKTHIRNHCGTAYHPVGTLALGGPVSEKLRVNGTVGLWVADASVMPSVTSANTNAPCMMIGWKGAQLIAQTVS